MTYLIEAIAIPFLSQPLTTNTVCVLSPNRIHHNTFRLTEAEQPICIRISINALINPDNSKLDDNRRAHMGPGPWGSGEQSTKQKVQSMPSLQTFTNLQLELILRIWKALESFANILNHV